MLYFYQKRKGLTKIIDPPRFIDPLQNIEGNKNVEHESQMTPYYNTYIFNYSHLLFVMFLGLSLELSVNLVKIDLIVTVVYVIYYLPLQKYHLLPYLSTKSS